MRLVAVFVLAVCTAYAQNPFFGVRWTEITKYLSLTDAQLLTVTNQNLELTKWQSTKVSRLLGVAGEIEHETKRSPLDPGALGIRYAEAETIRRQYDERTAQAVTENATVLTDAQKAKLAALEASQKLLPIAGEAQNSYLLTPDPPCQRISTPVFESNCQLAIYDPLMTALAIQTYLSLTNGQLRILRMHREDFQQWRQIKQGRIEQVRTEIADETAKSPLDPAALGFRYTEIEVIQREIADHQKQVITANLGLLDEPQIAKLKTLEESLQQRSVAKEAEALYLTQPACNATLNLSPDYISISTTCPITAQIRIGNFAPLNPLP